MKYIYCPSYPSLRLVLYFVSQKEQVTIITSNNDLRLTADQIDIPVIFLDIEKIKIPRVRQLLNPFNLIKFRNEFHRLFLELSGKIKEGSFYFTIHCIDLPGLHLILLFIKNRRDLKINYWQEYQYAPNIRVKYFIPPFKLAELIYVNLLYKPYLYYGKVAEGNFIFATKGFLQRKGVTILEFQDIWQSDIYKYIDVKITQKYAGSVILLGNYSLEFDFAIFKQESVLDNYRFLKKYYPNLIYKQHPGPSKTEVYFSKWKHAEKNVPSEILCKKARLVIGTATVSMNTLAKMGVPCISIIKLLEPQSGFDRDEWIKKMNDGSDGKIIFVKTKEELMGYLSNAQSDKLISY